MNGTIIAVLLAALTVTVVGAAFSLVPSRDEKRLAARIARTRGGAKTSTVSQGAAVSVRRDDGVRSSFLDGLAERLIPKPAEMRKRLVQAGLKLSVGGYLGTCLAIAVVTGLAANFLAGWSLPSAFALGISGGAILPRYAIAILASRRAARFNEVFPEAIDLIVRGLKSGLAVLESIATVGHEIPDPVGREFRAVSDAVRLGSRLEDALWDVTNRIATPEFKFFVTSLTVQKETGGNLGETLANLSELLRGRRQMRLKIKAMSSEARASAMILGSLPFIMFGLIYAINPSYESMLFTDPRGKLILEFGLGLMAVGIAVMRKMARFEI